MEKKYLPLHDNFQQIQSQPIVVIGSGLAGYMFVKEFRKLNSDTAIEMITLDDGAFYSKPLLSTALTQKKNPENLVISSAEKMATDLAIKIHVYTEVNSIDPEQRTITYSHNNHVETIEFSRLVIACGARVAVPIIESEVQTINQIRSVNTLEDYKEFRIWLEGKRKIMMIGSGLVGCEFANDLSNTDVEVEIAAPENSPLIKWIPPEVSEQLKISLEKKGVVWRLQSTVRAIDRSALGYEIILSSGEVVHADGVFAATGIKSNLSFVKDAGIKIGQGIIVNRWLQTNFPYIFALGDCAEVDGHLKQYVAPLLRCAEALAKILNGGTEPVHYPAMPIVVKTPACPMVIYPPAKNIQGEWHVEGAGAHLRALFHDPQGQLHGFALLGEKVRDKMELAKQMPLIFGE